MIQSTQKKTDSNSFAGVWRSHYAYHDRATDHEAVSEHYVRVHQSDNHLIIEAIPGANKAYVIVRLTLDRNIATGTWQEQTDPQGYYKGSTYSGALQLLVSDDKRSMQGKYPIGNPLVLLV